MLAIAGLVMATVVLAAFTLKPEASLPQKQLLNTVIIDAGHGGHDIGAEGRYSNEKTISLSVALKLAEALRNEFPHINFVLTRANDVYHHPIIKSNIANQNKGDLFISLHCNSASGQRHRELIGYKTETYYRKKKKYTRKVAQYRYWTSPSNAQGTETYIWGANKADAKEKVLKENESLYLDSTLAQQVSDFDPNSPEKMILYSLKTKQYFNRSANLAFTIEDEFKQAGRLSREARQRQVPIYVLHAVAMPAVLVEMGFISNPGEEDYLNSDAGQIEIATVIVRAFKRYKYSLENQLIEKTPKPTSK
jgi:N-acetylmuramoyl-L-alanine amidase